METDVDSTADGDNESLHSDDDAEDPCRIQVELDVLNNASDSINKLETELEKAKDKFVKTKVQAEAQLKQLLKKTGTRSVRTARPYYNQLKVLKQAQQEAQKAALKYQDAFSAYTLAKDAVDGAELQLALEGQTTTPLLDSACQEILNKATIALFNAEKEKIACEQEHHIKTSQCAEYQKQMTQLLKENPKAVQKAKRFYDLKDVLEIKIKVEKQNAEDLQLALACNKQMYKLALNNLEHISEEVHARRKSKLTLPPRTPGVGAEAESELSDLPSSTLDILSENTSQSSLEFCDDKTMKGLSSLSSSTHDLRSDMLLDELNSTFAPLHSRTQEADDINVKENIHRDDLLEGAENVREKVISEFLELDDLVTPTHSARSLPQVLKEAEIVSKEAESEDLVAYFAATMVSGASKLTSQSQKRSVAVRDLQKGIYVTNLGSSGNSLKTGTTNEEAALKSLEAGANQVTKDGQEKTLQQFPLLQSLMGSGLQKSTQSHQKF